MLGRSFSDFIQQSAQKKRTKFLYYDTRMKNKSKILDILIKCRLIHRKQILLLRPVVLHGFNFRSFAPRCVCFCFSLDSVTLNFRHGISLFHMMSWSRASLFIFFHPACLALKNSRCLYPEVSLWRFTLEAFYWDICQVWWESFLALLWETWKGRTWVEGCDSMNSVYPGLINRQIWIWFIEG